MKKYSGVLERVNQIEEKYGIKYAKPDGKLYKVLNIIYSVFWVYTLGINSLFILTMFFPKNIVAQSTKAYNAVIAVSVMTVALIVGYIINRKKKYLAGGIVNGVSSVFMLPFFANLTEDTLGIMGYKFSFYWRHLIPLCVMIALIIWLTVLAVRAENIQNKRYKQVSENLFNMYSKSKIEDADITDEEWDNFLKNYDPITNKMYYKQFQCQSDGEKSDE